ncbi:hypothetical protein FRC10_004986 [Ceratobasidium sp. 414]|nr:hypothetical protein FRC10_004986 [Ceratobasidium sp. 414]
MSFPIVKLASSDNEEFEVGWEVFRMFGLFAPQDEYCEHHKHDPPSPEENSNTYRRPAPMSDWDKTFITNFDRKTLFDIILAANYLSIKSLLNLGTRQVGNMIKGRTPAQIRELFNVVNDFTPEENESAPSQGQT